VADARADTETVMQYGEVLLRLERWRDAEILFASVVEGGPDSYRALVNWGVALESSGDWPKAVEAYRRAAMVRPGDPEPYGLIGALYGKLGRRDEALSAYQEALARDPRHAPSHLGLGVLAEQGGDTSGAIVHYETILHSGETDGSDKALFEIARSALSQLRRRGAM
jgi:Flp pilus assembly protein TadD